VTITEIHDYILFVLDKDSSGFVSDAEIDTALDRAQMTIFKHYAGNSREYQFGRPIPRVAYGVSNVVNEALSPFKEQATATPAAGSATFTISSAANEMMMVLNLIVPSTGSELVLCHDDEFFYKKKSYIFTASSDAGVAARIKEYNKGVNLILELQNTTFTTPVAINYLRRPLKPNKATSVTLEWKEPQLNEIMNEAIKILSINTQNVPATQFSSSQVNTGS
jgi:hypothetical protein